MFAFFAVVIVLIRWSMLIFVFEYLYTSLKKNIYLVEKTSCSSHIQIVQLLKYCHISILKFLLLSVYMSAFVFSWPFQEWNVSICLNQLWCLLVMIRLSHYSCKIHWHPIARNKPIAYLFIIIDTNCAKRMLSFCQLIFHNSIK